MTEVETLIERIDRLEIRSAYQDQAIEDLTNTVTEQFKEISELRRRLAHLEAQAVAPELGMTAALVPEAPPPHY